MLKSIYPEHFTWVREEKETDPNTDMSFTTMITGIAYPDGTTEIIPSTIPVDTATNRVLYSCENCHYSTFLPPEKHVIIRKCEQCKVSSVFNRDLPK